MICKKKSIGILVLGTVFSFMAHAGILKADNSIDDNYILEKTEDFSISYPMDWGKQTKGENLILSGPLLNVEQGRPKKPYIVRAA